MSVRYVTTLALNKNDKEIEEKLTALDIKKISIYRKGLEVYSQIMNED